MARTRKLPPFPTEIQLPGGPVKVLRVTQKEMHDGQYAEEKTDCLGLALPNTRSVLILDSLEGAHAWNVLHHEVWHLVMYDNSIPYTNKYAEKCCDAYASLRVFEQLYAPRPSKKRREAP